MVTGEILRLCTFDNPVNAIQLETATLGHQY